MAKIPHTLTRLGTSLSILSAHQTAAGTLPTMDANFKLDELLDYVASSTTVGATYAMEVVQNQTNVRRTGIRSPREAWAITPGPVMTSLRMQFGVLYIQNAMQAFGFDSAGLGMQTRPLIITEMVNAPSIDIGKILPQTAMGDILKKALGAVGNANLSSIPIMHIYLGCWFAQSSTNYKLDADQMVVQDVTIDVARVIDPNLLETGVALGTQYLARQVSLVRPLAGTVGEAIF